MSELKGVYLNEYYSDINQVRQYVNERIDSLKQLLDERKVQLNIQLDRIEEDASNDEGKSKKLIEKLFGYEKVTIELFGEKCSHLATIKSNIESLENDLSRKKLYFQWRDEIIVDNLEWLGVIAYESNDVYERIESKFKAHFSNTPQAEKAEENVTVISEGNPKGEQANIEKETISPAKKPPKIMKKPKINLRELIKSETEITTPVTVPPSLYDDIISSEPKHEYSSLSELQPADSDNQKMYETLDLLDNTSLTIEDSELVYDNYGFYESVEEVFDIESQSTSDIEMSQSVELEYETCIQQETATLCETNPNKFKMKRCKSAILSRKLDTDNYQVVSEITLVDQIHDKIDYRTQDELEIAKSKSKTLVKEKSKWVHDLPIIEWGNQGKGIRQLNKPRGVCVSEKGHIFVAEKGNNRVQVFSSDGNHLYMFGEKSGNNAMIEPHGIWITKHFVYITLSKIHTVQMYTLQGGFIKKKSKEGKEEGRFKMPHGIDGDDLRGKLYICDTGNNRIQIFDTNLHFMKVMKIVTQLYRPLDIKVTNAGNLVIVLDCSPRCIHVFKPSGESIKDIIEVHSFPKLINPLHLAVDTQGNILLSDYSGNCIHVFTDRGEFIWCLGEAGVGKPFIEPRGIAFDNQGRLVTVCNKKKAQLQIFEV